MTDLAADARPSDPDSPAHYEISPWRDEVVDALGHDPRSPYAERFWLPVLGPTSALLMRHLASRFDTSPDGFTLGALECARALGVGHREGKHAPVVRAVARLAQFRLLQRPAPDRLVARRKLPPLTRHQVRKLPSSVRAAHERWQDRQLRTPEPALLERRARRLAASLLEVGASPEETRAQLERWRFDPEVAGMGVEWAMQRTGTEPPSPPDAA